MTAFSFVEIEAWARMTGVTLQSWELKALFDMDATRREEFLAAQGKSVVDKRLISINDASAMKAFFRGQGVTRG